MSPRGTPAAYHDMPKAPTEAERLAVLRVLVLTHDRERAARMAGVKYDTAARVAAGSGWPSRERILDAYVAAEARRRTELRAELLHEPRAEERQRILDAERSLRAQAPRVTVDQVLQAAERSGNIRRRTLASIARRALSELASPVSSRRPLEEDDEEEVEVPLPPAKVIRAWAIAQGIPCLAGGPLRAEVRELYREAHQDGAPDREDVTA